MLNIKTVLFPTDFSKESNAALPLALSLARKHSAALRIAHVSPEIGEGLFGQIFRSQVKEDTFYKAVRKEFDYLMQNVIDTQGDDKISITGVFLSGTDTSRVLLENSESADVVVVGTNMQKGLLHVLFTSNTKTLIRKSDCPLLVVPTSDDSPNNIANVNHILAPVDFSNHAAEVIRYASALAQAYNSSLTLIHVIDPVQRPEFYGIGLKRRPELETRLAAESGKQLELLYAEVGSSDISVTFHGLTGAPSLGIIDFAEQNDTDLIVMASHGARGLKRVQLGSVTERVVRGASCPVFITKPFGKSLL